MVDVWKELGRVIGNAFPFILKPLGDLISGIAQVKPADIAKNLEAQFAPIAVAYKGLSDATAVTDPDSAAKAAVNFMLKADVGYFAANTAIATIEAITGGQMDMTLTPFLNAPSFRAFMSTAVDIARTKDEASILPYLRRYYLKMFKPFIPDIRDLRTMAVREAFPVEPGEPQYAEMEKWALEQGMDPYWTTRYLQMGFERMDLRQAYENLWRGYWTEETFKAFLRIADIHPDDRDPVTRVAFRAPSIREMGYGYDTGMYSVDDIVRYRRWGGLNPEDAEKAGGSMVAYRTEAEREALRREALYDFTNWLDDEAQLRVNLESIGGRPEIIELWVARAEYRRHRDFILDMVKTSVNQHLKGWITEDGLRHDLIDLKIVPEGREKIIQEARIRKLKYVREAVAEEKKVMPVSRVRRARDLGLVSDGEYVQRLVDHDWTPEDARLDLAIELTPRPVTPEEIERRQRTITSRLNRATRRWEARLKRVQDQVELTGIQLEDAGTTMTENLDVIDAQITVYDEMIPEAAPERVPVLEARRTVLVQRRELSEARSTARIRKLTEQQTDLIGQKDLMSSQRDEELSEYEEELKLLGVGG